MRREKRRVAALRRVKLQLKNLQKDYIQVSESFLAERAKTEQAKLQVQELEETVSKLKEKVVKLQKAASARNKRQRRRTPDDEASIQEASIQHHTPSPDLEPTGEEEERPTSQQLEARH